MLWPIKHYRYPGLSMTCPRTSSLASPSETDLCHRDIFDIQRVWNNTQADVKASGEPKLHPGDYQFWIAGRAGAFSQSHRDGSGLGTIATIADSEKHADKVAKLWILTSPVLKKHVCLSLFPGDTM